MRPLLMVMLAAAMPLAACQSAREAMYGPGPLSPVDYPIALAAQSQTLAPVATAAIEPQPAAPKAKSRGRARAKELANQRRPAQVGDLLSVLVRMDDNFAPVEAAPVAKRGVRATVAAYQTGLESSLGRIVPRSYDPTPAAADSGPASSNHQDRVTLTITVEVTEVSPTGNLRIQGRKDVIINKAAHTLSVSGVVRPADISEANTVLDSQIAEARIEYDNKTSEAAADKTAPRPASPQQFTSF